MRVLMHGAADAVPAELQVDRATGVVSIVPTVKLIAASVYPHYVTKVERKG